MKKTRVSLREDQYKAVTSELAGHNLDAMAFNLSLLAKNNHTATGMRIVKLYQSLPLNEENNA